MKNISFVIPVFRNAGSLQLTHEKISALFEDQLKNYAYEFIFVDDGSDDGSLDELLRIRENDKRVKIISFSRNFGQVPACVAGLKEVGGDAVVNISADLQDPPELIIQMVREWENGTEIVYCERRERDDSFFAKVASKIFYWLIKLSNSKMPTGGFDFLLLDRKAVDELNKFKEHNRFIQGDILWLGFRTKAIPYIRLKRTIGRSQWTFAKKLKYFIDGFLNTSYVSIRFMSLIGIITAAFGFLYAALIFYARIINKTPFPGWAPIMVLLLVIGGLVMFMLGLIGEYIWRIYDETRNRSLYIIEKRYLD